MMLQNGSRLGVPDILLIITDGQSDNPPQTWNRAVEARRQGINVIAVRIYYLSYSTLVLILSTLSITRGYSHT